MRLGVICISMTAVSLAVQLAYIERYQREQKNENPGGRLFGMPLATWVLTMAPLFASLASYNVMFGKVAMTISSAVPTCSQ